MREFYATQRIVLFCVTVGLVFAKWSGGIEWSWWAVFYPQIASMGAAVLWLLVRAIRNARTEDGG